MRSPLFLILGFAAAYFVVYKLRRRQFMQSMGISIVVSIGVFLLMNVLFGVLGTLWALYGPPINEVSIIGAVALAVGGYFLCKKARAASVWKRPWFAALAFLLLYVLLNVGVVTIYHRLRPAVPMSDLCGYSIVAAFASIFLIMLVSGVKEGRKNRKLAAQGVVFYRGLPLTEESYELSGSGGMRSRWFPRKQDEKKDKVTFDDVGGCTEAKIEIEEVVEFLKDPDYFREFGARPAKGILLTGGPGNGKTLLAKAVAGEADVPFFQVAGSDFVEKYVGVGPSKVRDLFTKANKQPSVIFIDEIDALAAARSADGTGNREYENTVNALLAEMDGMDSSSSVVVLAATNRPDILDPAAVRPGRFDRTVEVDHPDVAARIKIFGIHMRGKPLAPDVQLELLADRTAGFSGAEVMSACNESAIIAARRYKKAVAKAKADRLPASAIADIPKIITLHDCDEGLDRAKYGPLREARAKAMSQADKENSAWHELGHAVIAQHFGHTVEKITILPRGKGMAYVISNMVKGGQACSYDVNQMRSRICMLLGGRVATEVFLGIKDTGPSDDFTQVNKMARQMVVDLGMAEDEVGLISSCGTNGISGGGGRSHVTFGPDLLNAIDKAMRKIIEECLKEARELITVKHRARMEAIFPLLMKKETLVRPEWLAAWDAAGVEVSAVSTEVEAVSTEVEPVSTEVEPVSNVEQPSA